MPAEKNRLTKIFIDTLYVVALTNRRDQYHSRARELVKNYVGYPLITTDGVLLEIGNTLARRYKAQSIAIIERFKASENVEVVTIDSQLFSRGFELYQSHQDKSWGLVDCISFVVMKDAGIDSALTFDQHFIQAGFRALMRE